MKRIASSFLFISIALSGAAFAQSQDRMSVQFENGVTKVVVDGARASQIYQQLSEVPETLTHVQGQFRLFRKATENVDCSHIEDSPVSCTLYYPMDLDQMFKLQSDGTWQKQ